MKRKVTEPGCYSELNKNNKGFTLVELIVCVGILAAVSIPLVQSFSTAAIANNKAQALQDATSLAEDVMEDIKGNTIDELAAKYGGKQTPPTLVDTEAKFDLLTPGAAASTLVNDGLYIWPDATATKPEFMVLKVSNARAVNAYDASGNPVGETYDVVAAISTSKYFAVNPTTGAAVEKDDASDANSIQLPKMDEIDTGCHIALSKELNRYDSSAAGDIAEQYSAGSSLGVGPGTGNGPSDIAARGTKTIQIDMAGDAATKVTVDVNAIYSDGAKSVRYNIYTGTINVNLSEELYQPNIYLFYTPMDEVTSSIAFDSFANEEIVFNDYTNQTYGDDTHSVTLKDPVEGDALDTSKKVRHDLYLIMEGSNRKLTDSGISRNIVVMMTGPGGTVSSDADLGNVEEFGDDLSTMQIPYVSGSNIYGNRMFSNIQVGSDTEKNNYSKYGKAYGRKKKDRMYQVNIELTKNGDDKVYAELESTRDADYQP